MGIKDFNKILKNNSSGAIQKIPVSSLKGYRIAIDGPLWVHSNLAMCQKDMIMKMGDPLLSLDRQMLLYKLQQSILRFIISWCYKGVTTVWVWDGEPLPEKILFAKKKRNDARENIKNNIAECRVKLENCHILARNPADIARYKQLLCQEVSISKEEMLHISSFIKKLGFPNLTAENDSEKLCASLNK